MASVKSNFDGAEELARSLRKADKMRARVGIMGMKDKRTDGLDGNSDLGYKHEFGYVITEGPYTGARVPARSMFRMPLTVKKGEIAKGLAEVAMGLLMAGNVKDLFVRMGVEAEKIIRQAFDTSGWGSWAPNALATMVFKNSDKPLIDTGSLARSFGSKVVRKG
jgi:hypothetical protein